MLSKAKYNKRNSDIKIFSKQSTLIMLLKAVSEAVVKGLYDIWRPFQVIPIIIASST